MAEAILKSKNIANIEVCSAGVYATEGDFASEHAKSILKTKNMYSEHKSRRLSSELLDWATFVLTMTEGHKKTILMEYPDFAKKTFTLKNFVGETNHDIADPYGGTENDYLTTFRELEKLIEKLIQKLG
jgi:protein-tyrosine phosphatase